MEECTFVLNAQAKIPDDKILVNKVKKYCKNITNSNVKANVHDNNVYLHITTKSKCNALDVPNIVKGKRIAEGKAKKKLYDILAQISIIIFEYYKNLYEDYVFFKNRYVSMYIKERDHIEELDVR